MEIRKSAKSGRLYLVYRGELHRLDPTGSKAFTSGSTPDSRQKHLILNGTHGKLMQQYALACEQFGIPLYYSWSGVINSLGDHNSVQPPWKARALDSIPDYEVVT